MFESKIRNLKCIDGEWSWEAENFEGDIERFKTNSVGEGRWILARTGAILMPENKPQYTWQQIDGTCQFSLKDYTMSGARRKLIRMSREKE